MTNAKKFKQLFGIYATELWVMSEEDFLKWLNAEAKTEDCKGEIMTANKHQEENCYNCVYYHHDYWNCQGAEKPCHEYYPDDEAEEES